MLNSDYTLILQNNFFMLIFFWIWKKYVCGQSKCAQTFDNNRLNDRSKSSDDCVSGLLNTTFLLLSDSSVQIRFSVIGFNFHKETQQEDKNVAAIWRWSNFWSKSQPCKTETKRSKTKYIISRTYPLQLSAILTGLIKLRLHSFQFLIEASVTPLKKNCRFSYLIQVNIKNKLAVMDLAFRGPNQGKLLTW